MKMGRIVVPFIAMCLILSLLSRGAYGRTKGNGVEVRTMSGEINTESARTETIRFTVKNLTRNRENFIEKLEFPSGWKIVAPLKSFMLSPRGHVIRKISFQIPAEVRADSYEIVYSVRSQRNYSINDRETVTVNVAF